MFATLIDILCYVNRHFV